MLSHPWAERRFMGPELISLAVAQGSFYTGKSRDTKIPNLMDRDNLPTFKF